MAKTGAKSRRPRGHIRQRGASYQVLVYAGVDPLTGKDHYLTESASDESTTQKGPHAAPGAGRRAAERANTRHPRCGVEAWLKTHEAEETTLDGYRGYIRRNIGPALGDVAIGKITAQLLEEFYAACGPPGPA